VSVIIQALPIDPLLESQSLHPIVSCLPVDGLLDLEPGENNIIDVLKEYIGTALSNELERRNQE
jgi:hypothetical protein